MDLQRLKEASLLTKLKLVIAMLALAVSSNYIFSDSDNNVILIISSGLYFLAAILSLFTIKKPSRFINMFEVIMWLNLGVSDINLLFHNKILGLYIVCMGLILLTMVKTLISQNFYRS